MDQMQSIEAFYTNTTAAWDAMIKACENATTSIDLEEFMFDPDTIGHRFLDVLERKAKEGVKVRVLLDWYGCRELYKSDIPKRLNDIGVAIRFFRPPELSWLYSSPRVLPRDHRKLLIIDSIKTFVGGVCVYDAITDWRDTMVELSGPLTQQFEHIFSRTWQKIEGNETEVKAHPDFETEKDFTVYANAPDSNENHFTELLLEKLDSAEEHISLSTPYFTPGKILLPKLLDASKRGVKIEIILSNYSKYSAYVLGKRIVGQLIENGIHIYYYEPNMYHLKMMVIDNTWSAIGSCNLDGLSIHQNQEVMLISTHNAFVKELNTHFEHDKEQSVRFSYADWQARPLSQKIAGFLLSPLRYYI